MHWSACFLPDDYLRKMKQDLSEVEAQVESQTRQEPDSDAPPPSEDDPADLTSPHAIPTIGR
jgi:hypothetical protein